MYVIRSPELIKGLLKRVIGLRQRLLRKELMQTATKMRQQLREDSVQRVRSMRQESRGESKVRAMKIRHKLSKESSEKVDIKNGTEVKGRVSGE